MNEQTRTADGWTGYSQTDLAWYAKHYADTEWMVHVTGPDEIYTHANPDLDEDDPANPRLIERTAHVLAKSINELHASISASDPSLYRPFLHATVFHRGVPVTAPFDSDTLMAEPFERRDLNPIARVRDFLHVHVRVHGVSAPIAVIDESREPGGHRWVLTAADLGRALVPANRLRREELGLGPSRAATEAQTEADGPSVTEVRTALIRETSDFHHRRKPYPRALMTSPHQNPADEPAFDAYEGLVAAGCYAETLATVLRIVEERHPQTAADLAVLIHDVQENGNDALEGANLDVRALIERETQTTKTAD